MSERKTNTVLLPVKGADSVPSAVLKIDAAVSHGPARSHLSGDIPERLWKLLLGLIFVLSTSLCLAFNFSWPHPEYSYVGDPGGYQEESRTCLNFAKFAGDLIELQLAGKNATLQSLERVMDSGALPMPDLRMNGPVFPAFVASLFALSGTDPGERGFHLQHWYVPITYQCFLIGLNCVLIALVGRRLWNKQTGLIAGLFAAVYPGFIVNAERMTTETLACTLLLCVVLLVGAIRSQRHPFIHGGAMGALLTVCHLTRSVLVLLWLCVAPTALVKLRWSSIAQIVVSMAFGAVLFTAPWMAWQQQMFGQAKPLLDRAGVFNLYVGNDPDRQGWLSLPPLPPWDITKWSTADVFIRSYKASPSRFVKLQFDKPPRAFKTLWNDFRTPVGVVSYAWQVAFHQLLLVLAVVGICLAVFPGRKQDQNWSVLTPRLVLLEILALHAVYFLFAPVARYNLTAMPSLILLAAAGVKLLADWMPSPGRQRINALGVLGSMAVLLIVVRMDHAQFVLDFFSGMDAVATATIISICKAAALCAFIASLWFGGHLLYQNKGRLRAAILPVLIGLLLFPFLALPLRTYGRIEERIIRLQPGQSVERTIVIPPEEFRVLKLGPAFVAVDAANLTTVNNDFEFEVNGQKVNSGAIPGASLPDAAHVGEIPGIWNYRDGIFAIFCWSTGLSDTQLRQWFLLPLPPDLFAASGGRLHVVARAKQGPDARSVPMYATQGSHNKYWALPSFTTYSFDKAFYGSETDEGVTDPRFDDHIPSSSLRRQRLIPNVFCFAMTPLNIPSDRKQTSLISTFELADTEVNDSAKTVAVRRFSLKQSPMVDDFMLIRLRGKVRSVRPTDCGIDVLFKLSEGRAYQSEYSPRLIHAQTEPQQFDVYIPFGRQSFEQKELKEIELKFNATAFSRAMNNVQYETDSPVHFSDLSMELYRLPANPITKGFRVY